MAIVAPTLRKEFKPTSPTTRPAMKMRLKMTTARCRDGFYLTGTFVLVKLGSRMLKNIAPKPLAMPSLQAAKLNL